MKKKLIGILLSFVMVFPMMGSMAFADSSEATEAGVYDLNILNNSVTIVPMKADQTVVVAKKVLIQGQEKEEYEGAERFQVTVDDTTDQTFYLIVAKDENGAPTEKNLKYIDQKTSSNGSVIFDIYPSELVSGKTYYISMADNTGNTNGLVDVASFKYYEAYLLGDVDLDGEITSYDGLLALRIAAGLDLDTYSQTQIKVSDVDGDGDTTSFDGLLILRKAAGLNS